MTLVKDITKDLSQAGRNVTTVVQDLTPVYAVVGVTDLVVQKARDARERAVEVGNELSTDSLQARADKALYQVEQVPALALNQLFTAAGRAQSSYQGLASRGEKLVGRIRSQKATQDVVTQVETTMAQGKGAVSTARRAVGETQRAAKATVTTGRREAMGWVQTVTGAGRADRTETAPATTEPASTKASTSTKAAATRSTSGAAKGTKNTKKATGKSTAGGAAKSTTKSAPTRKQSTRTSSGAAGKQAGPSAAESVKEAADTTRQATTKTADSTRTPAKRTATTARRAAEETTTATQQAATSAQDTAQQAAKATTAAAKKVGD